MPLRQPPLLASRGAAAAAQRTRPCHPSRPPLPPRPASPTRNLQLRQALILRLLANVVSGSAAPPPNTSLPFLCIPLTGLNCEHSDIRDGGIVASVGEACAACHATAGCNAWTWNSGADKHVWLKSDCSGAIADPTATSGAVTLPSPTPPPPPPPPPGPPPPYYHNGVSIGGWLLTEPSWMYDQFSAPAEADLIASLRAAGGDAFAVATMRNHWAGYIPDAALDALAALGVTHCRIPVGYWIVEAPAVIVPQSENDDAAAAPPTMYTFGFNHEGFVTGGMAYLEAAIAKLKARGIKALVDVHALPGGGSQCQSYAGWQVPYPLFWSGTPPPDNTTSVNGCNGAGPYHTSRGSSRTWMEVGTAAILALGDWVVGLEGNASMSGTVVGLEVANEPGLQTGGLQPAIEQLLLSTVPQLQATFKRGKVATNVTVNFIGPNDVGAGDWLSKQVRNGVFDGSRLVVDFHQYYNCATCWRARFRRQACFFAAC